jgi:hypothetical protein
MDNLTAGTEPFEAGCDYSSVVFSVVQAAHAVISIFAEERDAIKQRCSANGIVTNRSRFLLKPPHEVLPDCDGADLALVVADGNYMVPAASIDLYCTADRLRQGGRAVMNLTLTATGTIFHEFLRMVRGRWKLETEIDWTSNFTKETKRRAVRVDWLDLVPFCGKRSRSLARRIRRKIGKSFVHPDDAILWT